MSLLNLNLSLPQALVLEALKEAEHQKSNLSDYVTQALDDYIARNSEEAKRHLFEEALGRALYTKAGDTFTLKELMLNIWDHIDSPKAFGREFKHAVLTLGIAEVAGKKADNKLIYKRTDLYAELPGKECLTLISNFLNSYSEAS